VIAAELESTRPYGSSARDRMTQRVQKKEGGLWKGNQGGKDLIAPGDSLQGEPGRSLGSGLQDHRLKKKKGEDGRRTIQDSEGNWAETRKETAMALIRKYFPVDYPETDTPDNRTTRETATRWNEERERAISLQELEKTVKERPKKQAPGIDGFPTAGLEHLFEARGETLAEVLNRCLKEGRFPKEWKQAEVAWIPKPGRTGVRPVCLLPTIGKVYDKILATRLAYYLEAKGLLSDRQFGFRKGRGTTEAIGKAAAGIKRAREEGKHAVLVALDIRNAFNSAWYPKRSQLLARSGCPGNLGQAISDFLRDRSVASDGATVKTERGCPQGSCLGPILWLLVMEEWFQEVDRLVAPEDVTVEIQAFADDHDHRTVDEGARIGMGSGLGGVPAVGGDPQVGIRAGEDHRRLRTILEKRKEDGQERTEAEDWRNHDTDTRVHEVPWRDHRQGPLLAGTRKARSEKHHDDSAEDSGNRRKNMGNRAENFEGNFRRSHQTGADVRSRDLGGKGRGSDNPATLESGAEGVPLGVTRAYRTTSNVALEVLAGCTPPHFEAAARHANWRERGTAEFEGKAVFAEGPHPAEPERKWEELPAETIPGASFWTDASQGEGRTAIGIVKTEGGETRETRGLRLQDGYPTHMAELYA
jgi:hypothetical protein